MAITAAAPAAWQRIGSIEHRPVNVACDVINGVKVASSSGIGQPENLVSTDVASSSRVEAGASEVIFDLGHLASINLASLVNDGAEGRVALSASVDQKAWNNLGQSVFTPADREVLVKFATSQAKYVRLQFDLSKGGTTRSLAVYGTATERDFDFGNAEPTTITDGLGNAQVIYVDPNPSGSDDTAAKYNRFDFPESPERFRTVIYDFGRDRPLTEIGSVHSARPVRLYAYTFKDKALPEKEDWRGRMSFDPAIFETQKPDLVVEDAKGVGYAKAKLDKAVSARYLALRWEPDFNPPAFSVFRIVNRLAGQPNKANYRPGGTGNAAGGGQNTGGTSGQDGQTTGDAASMSVTNPFAFTSGGFGGSGSSANPNQNNNNNNQSARPRPRPRPRSP